MDRGAIEKSIKALEDFFENTPKEILDEKFSRVSALEFDGPTPEEYLSAQHWLYNKIKNKNDTAH